jgi:hypothetical protein
MRDVVTGSGNTAMGYMSMIEASDNATDNVTLGVRTGQFVAGNGNVFIGHQSGMNNQGSFNLFIGYLSGHGLNWQNTSNRLIIHNGFNGDDNPLIYGEFDNSFVKVNGSFNVRDVLKLTPRTNAPSNPTEGDIYYDSTTHKLMVFNGSSWMACW